MIEALLLRFDGPLMSFGGTAVDQINPTDRYPGRAMLAGLLGNALGWDHADREKISALQDALRIAARWDIEPDPIVDYHTVDLGQDHLVDTGWTTRGVPEERGGASSESTHQRWRHYWSNGVCTLALTLADAAPVTLDELEAAIRQPARPLFIGRKACLPAAPLLIGRRTGESLRAVLAAEPLADARARRRPAAIAARWPAEEGGGERTVTVYDRRDWMANVPRGQHAYCEGLLEVSA